MAKVFGYDTNVLGTENELGPVAKMRTSKQPDWLMKGFSITPKINLRKNG